MFFLFMALNTRIVVSFFFIIIVMKIITKLFHDIKTWNLTYNYRNNEYKRM